MTETKKVTLEQQEMDGIKRIILEQGVQEDPQSQTPKWDSMKANIKEGVAEKTTLFGNAFIGGLGPAFIIGCLIIAVMFLICGR